MVKQSTNSKPKFWATAGITISWATFWMFLFAPFGLLIWSGILIYLIIKKVNLKWYFILSAWLFVPSCSFLKGTIQYATGTASIQGVGGPRTFHGIDSETRVVSTSSGCILVGFEPFVFPANNAAVIFWTNLFGYQRGAYNGAFPTEDEAQATIASADTINVKRIDNFLQFDADGQTIKVDTCDFRRYYVFSSSFKEVVGKAIRNECFVFQQVDQLETERRSIYVVDIEKGRLLKTYF